LGTKDIRKLKCVITIDHTKKDLSVQFDGEWRGRDIKVVTNKLFRKYREHMRSIRKKEAGLGEQKQEQEEEQKEEQGQEQEQEQRQESFLVAESQQSNEEVLDPKSLGQHSRKPKITLIKHREERKTDDSGE